jgi:hypothetical protein
MNCVSLPGGPNRLWSPIYRSIAPKPDVVVSLPLTRRPILAADLAI